jgi:D-inositol-3-phosphate glycosyltransferase
MPAFYRACDIVCIPSVAESFGRTVIEAFACGTPVVATAVGGIREIVTHEQTGLLVDYGDEKNLAEAVRLMLERDRLRNEVKANARRRAEALYAEGCYQQRLVGIAQDAVQRTTT